MEYFLPKIKEIAERITLQESNRKRLAKFLLSVKSGMNLSFGVEREEPDGTRFAAVDGGIVKRSVHGFDFILTRAAGVVFDYSKGKVVNVSYFPEKIPNPELSVMEALSDVDYVHSASVIRMKTEISAAIETVSRYKPDIMIMDGSIVPHYQDRPSKGSSVYSGYLEMISLLKRLISVCREKGTLLAGVVEDSRGTGFCGLVDEKILSRVEHESVPSLQKIIKKTRDTNLLYWILKEGERTDVFPYSGKPEDHPVLREFGKDSEEINSFYLKTAAYDRPVRVDFLGEKELAGKIGSMILSVSGQHSGYGLPSVLIEADQVAKLSEDDIENLYNQITNFTGEIPGIQKLRRDQRPF